MTMRMWLLILALCPAMLAVAQDHTHQFHVEFGVMAPKEPNGVFGLLIGEGANKSYTRFAIQADGTSRQVDTGIQRTMYELGRLSVVSRISAGVAQNQEADAVLIGSGQAGLLFSPPKLDKWGISFLATFETGRLVANDVIQGTVQPDPDSLDWGKKTSLTVLWRP